jgi:endoglucanase
MNTLIKEAERRGMYAIVDWHILSPGDPIVNLARAKVFFKKIASDNKDRKNLLYEIANEPNGDAVDWKGTVKPYAEALIPVIRAIDPNSVIIVGNPNWSSLKFYKDIINSPLEFPNIMYTFHFYAATHGERGLKNVRDASNKLPIFVTEFGLGKADGSGANDIAMTDKYLNLFGERQISWVGWSYSDAPETSAAWKTGTCPSGPWSNSNLSPSGQYVRTKLKK